MLNQVLIQVFFLSLFLVLTGQAYAAGEIVKRYAILVAANDGGSGRVPLRFTQSDAVSVRNVLQELGGLESSNSLLLQDPSPEEIEKAFVKIETKIRSDKTPAKRSELFFYYSGHSDETGLLLGQQRLAYARLKKALVGVNSDVQIAILDSCASGAFTRIKGGSHKPPFMVDESSRVKGYAILTSSSANENAQESDAVGGGYFTHYLVSALRGAGDTTLDKKVSLDEAYQYAFHETLAKTQDSLVGAQHAAYDFKLVGAGNLVLTELSQSSAALSIEKQLVGRLYVRDPSGRLVVELNKTTADATMDVSLAPDSYSVTLDQQGTLMGAQQRVLKGQRNVLRLSQFEVLAKNEDGVSRGSAEQAPLDPENDERYEVIPLKIS
ncbi:MAG: caspase family protein, partial [Gammaproteobacteria bacterium]|nr:caspase family protein [Gammaproteobacteria bacterium]